MTQTLVLEIGGRHAAQLGAGRRKTFEAAGGTIGRSADCDWVLAATGVSRVHAVVRYLNGIYFVEDRSTNGVLLNAKPVPRGEPAALANGDHLSIDDFDIAVQLQDPDLARSAPAAASEPAARTSIPQDGPDLFDLGLLGPDPSPRASAESAGSAVDDLIGGSNLQAGPGAADTGLDPLAILDPGGAVGPDFDPSPRELKETPRLEHAPDTSSHFRPPPVAPSAGAQGHAVLPENWDLTTGDFAPPPAAKPAPPIPEEFGFAEAVEPAEPAAPVQPAVPPAAASPPTPPAAPKPRALTPLSSPVADVPADVMQIFTIVIDGVMDVLRARAEIKNTFRLPVTLIQRAENNPLKFAPTAEDALQKILAPPGPAYLSGVDAFEDAFDDIRHHQMAMLAGVRAAFEALMAHFNPDRYQAAVDGGSRRSALMGLTGKNRYWEKYCEQYEALASNPDDTFRQLFGEEFARAYEEQLAKLRSTRKRQSSQSRGR